MLQHFKKHHIQWRLCIGIDKDAVIMFFCFNIFFWKTVLLIYDLPAILYTSFIFINEDITKYVMIHISFWNIFVEERKLDGSVS